MVVGHTYLKTEIKYRNPHVPKVKAVGVFHIEEDSYTLVAGFKARSG